MDNELEQSKRPPLTHQDLIEFRETFPRLGEGFTLEELNELTKGTDDLTDEELKMYLHNYLKAIQDVLDINRLERAGYNTGLMEGAPIWKWVWINIKVFWEHSRFSTVIVFPVHIILLLFVGLVIGRDSRTSIIIPRKE